MLKYTTEQIIQKFVSIHQNKYDYSKFQYLGTNKKSIFICPIHGEFLQVAKTHLKGQGCAKCGKIRLHNLFKLTADEFINKALKVHNGYNYSKVNYINGNTDVIILCNIHGEFKQRPYDHLFGKGCYKCGRQKLVMNRLTHDFTKTRWIQLSGNKKCYFYCFKFSNDNEEFFKLGITTNLELRHYRVKDYKKELLIYIESTANDVWNLEQKYRKLFKNMKYIPNIKFSGSNECFSISNEILNQIQNDKSMCSNRD